MGSPKGEEGRQDRYDDREKQHLVTLTQGFWMARTECTRAQYRAVTGDGDGAGDDAGAGDLPVVMVSWNEAIEFCRRLAASADLPPGAKVSLPTEAQWEYACRACTQTPFHFGAQLNGNEANCNGSIPYGSAAPGPNLGRAVKVASYPPNALDLHDMHGNVWEWCQDRYAEDFYAAGQVDPAGPATGSTQVYRGGSWRNLPRLARSAHRGSDLPTHQTSDIGFRVIVTLAE